MNSDKLKLILSIFEEYKSELPKHGWYPRDGLSLEWWAGLKDSFHIILTAILVMRTRWVLAERVFNKLRELGLDKPSVLAKMNYEDLALKLTGINFKLDKARVIVEISRIIEDLNISEPVENLRIRLLKIKGVGRETIDSILLYAFNKPTIPVSNQTKRVLERLGIKLGSYERARAQILEVANKDIYSLKLLHASMTAIARDYCKPKKPKCNKCPLRGICSYQ
ncbi:MAG: hypothetical protein QXD80_01125 [Acidilobaceae archaeon]